MKAVFDTNVLVAAFVTERVFRDPDDDQIISCALSAKADYLVTGDMDLLELKEFHGIKILTPGAFGLLFED